MRLILTSFLILFSFSAFAQWGSSAKEKTTSFFDSGNKTQVIVNKDDEQSTKNGKLSEKESTWNADIEGLAYMMPDQPAPDQTIVTFTGFGTTYKFSDRLHIVGKWMQFDIKAKNNVVWTHDHRLLGAGIRWFFADHSQQIQFNLLSGFSEVTGNGEIGKVRNLEAPIFLDVKYMWVFGNNLMIGPQITFGRVPNKCEDPVGTYTECGHGGYTAVSIAVQFGLPENWGQ